VFGSETQVRRTGNSLEKRKNPLWYERRAIAMESEISEARLRHHVHQLAATVGGRNVYRPEALHAAANYIRTTWCEQDYGVNAQRYEAEGVPSANLEITRRGVSRPEEILLIGAHYDSVQDSPGANDDGSGVAALLELARLFAGIDPACTVRFVAFVNEEPPYFPYGKVGRKQYPHAARQRGDDIRLMIALETIGSYSDAPGSHSCLPPFRYFLPDRANFIGFVSNFRSRRVMRQLARAYRGVSDFPMEYVATFAAVPGVAWSDRYKLNYGEFARMTSGLFRALRLLADTAL